MVILTSLYQHKNKQNKLSGFSGLAGAATHYANMLQLSLLVVSDTLHCSESKLGAYFFPQLLD
jgi:hypothetical protein